MSPLRRTALLVLSGLLATACSSAPAVVPAASSVEGAGYRGQEPDPVPPRPSFVLTDTSGGRYDFAAETAGRPTYVFFGYTHCPDECPTAMADISTALRQVPAAVREQVRVVFVTTDPARDTGPVLRRWLNQWSPQYVGLRGTAAELAAVQRAVGTEPAATSGPIQTLPGRPDAHPHKPGTAPHKHDGPLGYGVTHSSVIFAYDAADRGPVVYPGGVLPSDLAADLPTLAR